MPPTEQPDSVVLHGIVRPARGRSSTAPASRSSARSEDGDVALGDGTLLRVTRGRTAREESRAAGGTPVVVIDRMVTPGDTTGRSQPRRPTPMRSACVAALLGQGGIARPRGGGRPGLVVARTLAVIANEAWETALHGVATPADIDVAMQLGHELPVGSVRVDAPVGRGRRARDPGLSVGDVPRHALPREPRPAALSRRQLIGATSQRAQDVLHTVLGVAEEHGGVLAVEQRVGDAGVAGGHGALEDDDVVCLPDA